MVVATAGGRAVVVLDGWAEGGGRAAVVEVRLRLRGGGGQVDRQARVDRDVVGREGRRESRMGLLGGVRCV